MNISISNCNNIESGRISIFPNRLNIKYAINGTGKSSIAKAIEAHYSTNPQKGFEALCPYGKEIVGTIAGLESFQKAKVFNEEYVATYLFKADEVVTNSFEIFVKTPDYERHLKEIEEQVKDIKDTLFQENPELSELSSSLQKFIDSFGKASTKVSVASTLGKGLSKGNTIHNIPKGLESYQEYLQSESPSSWLNWVFEGKKYGSISDKQCPYCTSDITPKKENIELLETEYDSKIVESLKKILDVVSQLEGFLNPETKDKILEITSSIEGLSKEAQNYLLEVKNQAIILKDKIDQLKTIGYISFVDEEKVIDQLKKFNIEISLIGHWNSELTALKVKKSNLIINKVIEKAGLLQGAVAQQKNTIRSTIEKNTKEINEFLETAGYKYKVSIEGNKDGKYKLQLSPTGLKTPLNKVESHLSFGEKNALSLILFMYEALHENCDLIILDDPISSFDSNKKYAIMHMLFRTKDCLNRSTVLMLTHDFSPVIDSVYILSREFKPKAYLLHNSGGVLEEKEINKSDIVSCEQIFSEIAENPVVDILTKLVCLRRKLEISGNKGIEYELLANLFHKRSIPWRKVKLDNESELDNVDIELEQIKVGEQKIAEFLKIPDFSYDITVKKFQDEELNCKMYKNKRNKFEKIHLYRLLTECKETSMDSMTQKYINESYHIENEYLFQLNPMTYDLVPDFIIKSCDDILKREFPQYFME